MTDNEKVHMIHQLLDELANSDDNPIVDHIKREIPIPNNWMDRMMRTHIIRMGQLFSVEGHSGFSAPLAITMLKTLLAFEPWGPLTGEDDEWEAVNCPPEMVAQNKRCSHVFKREDGTAYDTNGRIFREPNGVCFSGKGSHVDIPFPYVPTTEYVDVPYDREETK